MTLKRYLPFLIILILLGIVFYQHKKISTIPFDNTQTLINEIDSLNCVIMKLRSYNDSIISLIDSSETQIKIVEHWYEKEFIDITNQSIADDILWFSNYISEAGK